MRKNSQAIIPGSEFATLLGTGSVSLDFLSLGQLEYLFSVRYPHHFRKRHPNCSALDIVIANHCTFIFYTDPTGGHKETILADQ